MGSVDTILPFVLDFDALSLTRVRHALSLSGIRHQPSLSGIRRTVARKEGL